MISERETIKDVMSWPAEKVKDYIFSEKVVYKRIMSDEYARELAINHVASKNRNVWLQRGWHNGKR